MEYYRDSCIKCSCLYLVALLSIIQPSLCTENYDINDTDFLNPNFEIDFSIESFPPDLLEQYTTEDTDGDGLRNLDSNNAGIPNVVEAGPTENDSIGPDKRDRPPVTDTDGDGVNDNRDADDDNDGIPDLAEQTSTQDTDNDNVKDVLDLDSDNDGIADVVEAGYADVDPIDGRIDNFVDSDSDGLCDDIDPDKPSPDTDNDGDIDCRDHDSDDDGIPDLIEAGGEDADRDGEIDNFTDNTPIDGLNDSGPLLANDTDGDGLLNYCDPDSDDDGIPDKAEAGSDPYNPADTDGDGVPDYLDLDSDDDGIPDEVEAGSDPSNPVDTDGDGVPDYLDFDSDDDGLDDDREGWWLCSRTDPDTNGDQINDSASIDPENPDRTYPYRSEDISRDNDVDGDGLPDAAEMHEVGTDFKIFSTDGDLYGDGQEYFHVNMPEISPADHPLVAAYPGLKVVLKETRVTPIAEITSTTGGSNNTGWSITHETSIAHTNHQEGGGNFEFTPSLSPLTMITGGKVTLHYMGFWEKTTTTTDSNTTSGFTQEDWSTATTTSLDEAAKLAFTLNVKNIGMTPAENVVPNVNIKLGEVVIATVTSPTSITSLDRGETSADVELDQGLVGNRGEDITTSFEQLKSIDCGTPLSIESFKVDAKVKKWSGEKNEWVCTEEDFSTYMEEIDKKTATLMFDLEDGVYKEYKVYAGSSVTLGDAINWTIGSDDSVPHQNNTKWVLGVSDIDALKRAKELNDSNRSIGELELEPGWHFILTPQISEKPKIHWAGYSLDMTRAYASVTDGYGIKSVIAHVKVNGEYRNLTMTDDDNDTIYETSVIQVMRRDKNATIIATNLNNSSSQLEIGLLPDSVAAPFSDGWYVFTVKNSEKCLDGSDEDHDYNAYQYKGGIGPKQRWYLEHIGHGYYIVHNNDTYRYLEVDHGMVRGGANVQSGILEFDENCYPKMYQQWYFEPVGDGYYKIGARHSGNYLSVERARLEDSASVIQDNYTEGDHQKWMVQPLEIYPSMIRDDPKCTLEDEYLIEAKHSSLCLSVVEGEEVVQSFYFGESGQNWMLKPVGDGCFKIVNGDKCLATSDRDNTSNGVDVVVCDYDGSENQVWRFEPAADGYCKIISKYSDRCLEVAGGSKDGGANVQQYDYLGYDYQRWKLVKSSEYSTHVVLFNDTNYDGSGRIFTDRSPNIGDFGKEVRSFRSNLPSGYAIILYEESDYKGKSQIFLDSSVPYIGDWLLGDVSSFMTLKISDLGHISIVSRGSVEDDKECYLTGVESEDDNSEVDLDDYKSDDDQQLWKLEEHLYGKYVIVNVDGDKKDKECVLVGEGDEDALAEVDLDTRDASHKSKGWWFFKLKDSLGDCDGYYRIANVDSIEQNWDETYLKGDGDENDDQLEVELVEEKWDNEAGCQYQQWVLVHREW
ncbi:MAG TPA: RICIN domain-containing protein [Methanothrix sp.]|nr:RICIN domain-containing protein [Methanothrix sp.]HRW82605.1 RICIN domain-containing protein [Methanothrix sp.]